MANWNQGTFEPKNTDKYVGPRPIKYKSSWELTMMRVCDNHPNILYWSYEGITIPYYNPIEGKYKNYVPDFLIVYKDKKGKQRAELVEIKPDKETMLEKANSTRDKYTIAINHAKWQAAETWAKRNNMNFRVMTQDDIYMNNPKPKQKQNSKKGKKKKS